MQIAFDLRAATLVYVVLWSLSCSESQLTGKTFVMVLDSYQITFHKVILLIYYKTRKNADRRNPNLKFILCLYLHTTMHTVRSEGVESYRVSHVTWNAFVY